MMDCLQEAKNHSKSIRIHLANLLKIYLNLQYVFLCCPFRIEIAKDGKSAIIKSNIIHKTFCFTTQFLGFLWILRNFQLSNLPSNPKDPSMYLLLALHIDGLFMKFATIKRYWFDSKKLLQIVNCILDNESCLPFSRLSEHILWTPLAYLLAVGTCLLYTGMGILHYFTGCMYYVSSLKAAENPILHWNSSVWWEAMLSEGRFIFYLDNTTNANSSISSSLMESVCGILAATGYLCRLVLGVNEELFVLIITLVIWISAKEFHTRLSIPSGKASSKTQIARRWSDIHAEYEAIKSFAEMISNVFGWSVLIMVIQTTLFNSVYTDDIFLSSVTIQPTKMFSFAVNWFTISGVFLLMANVCKKVICPGTGHLIFAVSF